MARSSTWTDIGPAQINYNSIAYDSSVQSDSGTHGGVQIMLSDEGAESLRDATGKMPKDKIITGRTFKVKAHFTGLDVIQFNKMLPSSTLNSASSALTLLIGNPAGHSMADNSAKLIVKPIEGGTVVSDKKKWITAMNAHPLSEYDFAFAVEDQKVYAVTFECFPNSTGKIAIFGNDSY